MSEPTRRPTPQHRPQGSHEHVLADVGRRIAGGALPPGTVLTLAGLVAEYGASRTVVREAVRVLEDHGMLRSRRRVGITVRDRADWDSLNGSVVRWRLDGPRRQDQLVELAELRTAVEPAAARLAAGRADAAQRDRLAELADVLVALGEDGRGDGPDYLAADVEFHSLLLAASGNALLGQLAGPVREVLTARTQHGLTPARPDPAALRGHVEVAHAVSAGDADAAEAGARRYVVAVAAEVADAGCAVRPPGA